MKIMKHFIGVLLSVGLLMVGGCKEEEDELAFDINPTESNVCGEVAEVVCHNSFQCCVGAELEATYGIEVTTNESSCRRDVELMCEQQYSGTFHSLGLGRISLDLTTIGTCLEQMLAPNDICFPYESIDKNATAACNDIEQMIQGLVPANGDCLFDFDCAGDAFCDVDRKCKILPIAGELCDPSMTDDMTCKDGLHCTVAVSAITTAIEYRCAANVLVGAGCNVFSLCADGLYCKEKEEADIIQDTDMADYEIMTGTCTQPNANGLACEGAQECESTNCLPGFCADGRECLSESQCGGECLSSGADCSADTPCASACVGGTYEGSSCITDDNCYGSCSLSTAQCSKLTPCTSVCVSDLGTATSTTCVDNTTCETAYAVGYVCTPQTCEEAGVCTPDTCQGASACAGRKCAENFNVTDYCDLAWQWFPKAQGN